MSSSEGFAGFSLFLRPGDVILERLIISNK